MRRMKQALPSNGWLVIGGVAFLTALILISSQIAKQRNQAASMALSPTAPPEIKRWGFSLNTYQLTENTLRSGDVLGEILMRQGLTYPQVAAVV